MEYEPDHRSHGPVAGTGEEMDRAYSGLKAASGKIDLNHFGRNKS